MESPRLPEGLFMEQVTIPCNETHYGSVFYTCYKGTWTPKEECRSVLPE